MDRISHLSDDLLIRILSFVPTKEVVATCCLSKRWELLWSLVPDLGYNDSGYSDENYANFSQFVYRSLLSNKAPVLERLSLYLGPKCQAVDVGIWIDTALSHCLRTLRVNIHSSEKGPISFPSSMYTCATLENLTLWNCIRLDIPLSVCLPSLNFLHLKDVDYAGKRSLTLTRLLSGCPELEHFVVEEDKLDHVVVVLPSVEGLVMINDRRDEKSSGFVIDAPSLVNLYIEDGVLYDFHRVEYMPELEKAHVHMYHGVNHKFLKAFTSARWLYLCLSLSEVLPPCGMIFHNLVDLKLSTCTPGWWDLLTHMLQNSPKLGFLQLINDKHQPGYLSIDTPDCWKRPSSVPNCLLHSFEALEWNGYKGRRGDREMVTYLLANATHLKKAVLSPESDDVAAKYRMLQDLASVATPSPWFQLFFDGK